MTSISRKCWRCGTPNDVDIRNILLYSSPLLGYPMNPVENAKIIKAREQSSNFHKVVEMLAMEEMVEVRPFEWMTGEWPDQLPVDCRRH